MPILLTQVFIPGGGFIQGDIIGGNGTDMVYNGTFLATKHNAIVLFIQYRINVFGFLALPQLMDESPDGTTGNYGLQDQRLGLQWVQDNIAGFGGDPGRVMLFGESAGGSSAAYHLTSPASAGLFSSVLLESAVASNPEYDEDDDDDVATHGMAGFLSTWTWRRTWGRRM